LVVGAGGDRDDVLAGVVDRDHGYSGRGVLRDADADVADSFVMQGGQQAAAEVVAADTPRHAHIGAQPGRRDRLVGTLPAGREPGRRAEHGRAGFGQPGHGDGDIHVQAAQHGDPRTIFHARTLARPRPAVGGRIGPGSWPGKLALPPGRAAFYTRRVPRQFRQVDVFTDTPYLGNPVAVVLGADGLSAEQMQ